MRRGKTLSAQACSSPGGCSVGSGKKRRDCQAKKSGKSLHQQAQYQLTSRVLNKLWEELPHFCREPPKCFMASCHFTQRQLPARPDDGRNSVCGIFFDPGCVTVSPHKMRWSGSTSRWASQRKQTVNLARCVLSVHGRFGGRFGLPQPLRGSCLRFLFLWQAFCDLPKKTQGLRLR